VANLGPYHQVNFQVPWDASGPATLRQGNESAVVPGDLADWGRFFQDAGGSAIAQHAAGQALVTADQPARPGEWVLLYGANFSPFDPRWTWSIRMVSGDNSYRLETNYLGLAPDVVYQFNLRMPDALPGGGETWIYVEGTRDCGFSSSPAAAAAFSD
jgi:uncharacterized protein (TIGR03437 family)